MGGAGFIGRPLRRALCPAMSPRRPATDADAPEARSRLSFAAGGQVMETRNC